MTVTSTPHRPGRLFRKYVWLLVALLGAVLVVSGGLEAYYSYQENKKALLGLQTKEARAAAGRIEQMVAEVERRIALMVEAQWDAPTQQLTLEYLRLLREVPAITDVAYLDASGKEQLRLSRLALDVIGSQQDLSGEESFTVAKSGKTYFSPVAFREESEPYMKVAVAGSGADAGVAMAEIDLKLIWEVISRIKIGKAGHAHVVDAAGLLVAHPNISLVLRKTSLASLPHIRDALRQAGQPFTEAATIAQDSQGRRVLTAFAPISLLGWTVFVEQPLQEAFEPLYASLVRTGVIALVGLGLSVLASLVLARKIVRPIQALQAGADRIGAGTFDQHIEIRSGDELEALAESFNRMGTQLQESYATLEQKVAARTRELARANAGLTESLEQQTATAEILRVIASSPTDIQPVLDAVARSATRLCEAYDATITLREGNALRKHAHHGPIPISWEGSRAINRGWVTGRAVVDRQPIHVHDLAVAEADFPLGQADALRAGHRTTLAVPLLREGEAIGVILIRRLQVRPFTDNQIALLQTFADQAVIAIENVRLFGELRARTQELTRSVEELTALGEVGQAVGSTLDLDKVLTTIVTHAVQLSKTDGGTIFEFDEAEQVFVPRANYGISDELVAELRRSRIRAGDESAIGQMSVARAPIQIADLLNAPGYPRSFVTREGFRALLAVPMAREDRMVGALVVRRRSPGEFDDKTVELLRTFAAQSTLAVQNARLFREIEAKSRVLEELSQNQEQLSRLSAAMQEPLSLVDQLTRVLDAAREVVRLDRLYVWTLTADGAGLAMIAQAGFAGSDWEALRGITIPMPEAGAMAAACEQGVPLLFTGERPLPPEYQLRPPYADLDGLRVSRFLVIPMIARGRTVGVLAADNRVSRKPIAPSTVELLRTFGSQAAVAVENARLFQDIQEKGRQLEVASRHKSDFLASVSHELRTPLNAILGFNEMILGQVYGDVPPDLEEPLRDIQNSGKHLLRLINNVLDLAKIEAGRMELAPSDYAVQDVVESVRTALRPLAAEKGLEFAATVDPEIPLARGDAGRITQCLMNLVGNAVKFTREGRVEITVGQEDGLLIYRVADTGIGIAADKIETVFAEFRQEDATIASEFGGTGLGLSITKKFVELHGGRIWVKSEVGKGSTFFFAIPFRLEGATTA